MALTDVKSEQIQSSVALAGSPTTTTQSASDNSTKIATTAYVETAVANLVASAPAALNTLDELAAALNDDASFSTTITNSIAAKLPLAGGTMTGDIISQDNRGIKFGTGSDTSVYNDGSNFYIKNNTLNQDIIFQGNDDGSTGTTVLTLDMSNAGKATFNAGAAFGGGLTVTGGASFTDDVVINNGSPEMYFGTTGNHYNWRIAAQEIVDAGFEIAVGSQDTDYSNDTYTQIFNIKNTGNATFAGTGTFAGGAANNNDDANILTLNASQHARLLVDTSSTGGHRATLALESNGNELTLSTTGSTSYLGSVGNLEIDGGNVIINKSNFSSLPTGSKLNIFGDGVTLRLDGSSATTKSILFRQTNASNPGEVYADGSLRFRTEDASTRISFHTYSTGSNNERMRIDGSGHAEFYHDFKHNPNNANGHRYMLLNRTSGKDGHLIFRENGTNQWQQVTDSSHNLNFYSYQNGSRTQVQFLSGGDIEINDGNLIVQNGHGIDFSDTTGPTHTGTGSSELLDDYEEGTFTPTPEAYYGNSVNFSGSFSGWYVKVGAKVTVMYKGDNFSFTSGSGGDLVGFRLPFNPVSGQSEGMGNIITNSWAASGRHLGTLLLSTANALVGQIGSNNNNGSWAWMDFNTVGSSNTSFRAIFTYFVTN